MTKFKIVVISIFSVSIVVGLILFAMANGGASSKDSANLLVWGVIDQPAFDALYMNSSVKSNKNIQVQYIKKSISEFQGDFVEALANGQGPDVVIIRDDMLYQNKNKVLAIPYKSYSERDFKDRFIEEGELLLTPDGVLGFPIMIDPMVMYWNRDIFSNNHIAQTPKYWDEIYGAISKITKKDSNANILQATIALGEWRNIVNAKEILSMLLLQAGTTITETQKDNKVLSVLNSTFGNPIAPSQSAVSFYTQFSNPTSDSYTWNRSMPNSLNMFLAGNLATYIGFASEIFNIQQKNSNLNFDVTYVPQIRNSPRSAVFGHLYSASVVKQSKQVSGAFTFVVSLTEPAAIKNMETVTNLPPVRRDLLSDKPSEAYRTTFYNSALISHSWIDPNPTASSNTFRDMIESITGGKSKISEALGRAENELMVQLK